MRDNDANPMRAAQRLARQALPRRFYEAVTVARRDGGFALLLDGHTARTPGRAPLAVGDEAVATALAAEWAAQGAVLDPKAMPLTRIVNAAIDRVSGEMDAVRAEIARYAMTDLVCYRAEGPAGLVAAEDARWSPLVAWAQDALRIRLALAQGVMAVAQDPSVAAAVRRAVEPLDPLRLAALSAVTTLTGSAVIGLALHAGRLSADAAWEAAHVDEDWQMSQWGRDEMALAARAGRRREFDAAALILAAGRSARGG
jgi:chaperone required for assembly of F1-ATPase